MLGIYSPESGEDWPSLVEHYLERKSSRSQLAIVEIGLCALQPGLKVIRGFYFHSIVTLFLLPNY